MSGDSLWGGPQVRSRPLVGSSAPENPPAFSLLSFRMFYRRRLPHLYEIGQPVFLTWRLHGSLPPHRFFRSEHIQSGKAFVAMDRLLDEARIGPFYLAQSVVADMILDAFEYNSRTLEHYDLHAF